MASNLTAIRYRQIRDAAGSTLLAHPPTLPVHPEAILTARGDCRLLPYSAFGQGSTSKAGPARNGGELGRLVGSPDGFTVFHADRRQYLVIYNDNWDLDFYGRTRWTLAHELGHIFLGHFENENTRLTALLDGAEQALYEAEANYFASMLLSYPILVRDVNPRFPEDLMRIFSISHDAAVNRLNSLRATRMLPSETDRAVLMHFKGYGSVPKLHQSR